MKFFLNCSALALAAYMAGAAAADGYVTAGQDPDVPVRSQYGECVHDSEYRAGMRFADCEPAPVKPVAAAPAPQAEAASAPADEAPAPAPAPEPVPQNVPFRLSTETFFDFDKAVLKTEGEAALDDIAARLAVSQYDTITIVGHADRIGPAQYNEKISERRANAMRDYLIEKGIPADKISASALGQKNPVAQCSGLRGARLIACLQPDRYAELTTAGTAVQLSAAGNN